MISDMSPLHQFNAEIQSTQHAVVITEACSACRQWIWEYCWLEEIRDQLTTSGRRIGSTVVIAAIGHITLVPEVGEMTRLSPIARPAHLPTGHSDSQKRLWRWYDAPAGQNRNDSSRYSSPQVIHCGYRKDSS